MFAVTRFRRRLSATAALAVLTLAACSDSADPHEHAEPEVASMVVTIGGTDYTATESGFGAQTVTVTGASVEISAAFLNADGEPDHAVEDHAGEFQLSVAGNAAGGALPAGTTFTRSGPFAGTLTVPAGQTVTVFFGLFHTGEQHDDFGPFPLAITRP